MKVNDGGYIRLPGIDIILSLVKAGIDISLPGSLYFVQLLLCSKNEYIYNEICSKTPCPFWLFVIIYPLLRNRCLPRTDKQIQVSTQHGTSDRMKYCFNVFSAEGEQNAGKILCVERTGCS